ncbi:MAG: hypothetical protein QG636_737 [Patescibacteria group bacterium]|nr:hypothetical protein [Patescibacteria group bacterium]
MKVLTGTKFLAFVHLEGLSRFIARAYADEEKVAQEESFGYDDRNNLEAFAVGVTGIAPAFTAPEPAPVAVPSTPVIQEAVPLAPQASSTVEVPVVEPVPVPVVEVVPAPVTPEASVEVPVNVIQEVVSFLSAPFRTVFAWAAPFMARAVAQEVVEVLPEAAPATTGESIVVWNTRDALDNLTETENQRGEVTKYRYDSKADALIGKTVTSAQGSVLSDINYGFDSTNSRWTSRTENGKSESYEYDSRGQLISGTGSYAYDEHGNRVSSKDSRGEGSYTYEGNRLLALVRGDATKSYEYDDNGNVVAIRDSKKGATTLSYTSRGAIAGIKLSDGTQIRYTYDALNRRVEKSVGNRIERYQYEGKNLTRVLNESGTVLRQYVYDPKGALIAIIRDQAVYSVILDAKGSVVALTDSRSEVVARFSYDAWGTPESTDTGLTDFYFASGYYEAEAGLYILGPRTYDPSLGRFLQKDPLAGSLLDLVSQNEYVYANNDPVNKIDPTGHRAEIASVGQSAKAIAASARAAARQMGVVVAEKKKEIADLEADPLSSPDDLLAARGALAAALESKEAMLELAKNNEEDVARREAREIEEALADAAWQASLQSVAAPVLEATTTPEIVPTVETAPAEVPIESVEPPVIESTGPVGFFKNGSGFVSESLYKLVPKVEAKKKKSKSKKSPPPPKKKAKEKAPKKLSKAEQREQEKVEKVAKALKNLITTKKAHAAEASLATTQKKGSAPLPSTAITSQATKKEVLATATTPSKPASKPGIVDKSTAPTQGSKIAFLGVSLNPSSIEKWVQEGASALYDQSPAWRYAMNNPVVTGAAVGVGAGLVAYGASAALTSLSVNSLSGIGARSTSNLSRLDALPQKSLVPAKLGQLSEQLGKPASQILQDAVKNGKPYIDFRNGGNINILSKMGSDSMIRITTDPTISRIISAGRMETSQVTKLINSGNMQSLKSSISELPNVLSKLISK